MADAESAERGTRTTAGTRGAIRRADWPRGAIFTIGHSTRSLTEFVGLLQQVPIDLLVDVRSFPRSRRNPQYNVDALPVALAPYHIDHLHIAALGGMRGRTKSIGPSPNDLWRNDSFRNYADYTMTDAFRDGLNELLDAARGRRAAIMCAEAVWWRCHRRIITDFLLARDVPVFHIMALGKIDPGKITPGAQPLADGRILYRKGPDDIGEFSLQE